MVKGKKGPVEHRGSRSREKSSNEAKNEDQWDPRHPDDDPYRDMRDQDDMHDPAEDEYVWPEYVEEEDD